MRFSNEGPIRKFVVDASLSPEGTCRCVSGRAPRPWTGTSQGMRGGIPPYGSSDGHLAERLHYLAED